MFTLICLVCAIVEGTASALIRQHDLRFRNTLRRHRVPLDSIVEVIDGFVGFGTGAFRAVSVRHQRGVVVVRPTAFIGNARRATFVEELRHRNPSIISTRYQKRSTPLSPGHEDERPPTQ